MKINPFLALFSLDYTFGIGSIEWLGCPDLKQQVLTRNNSQSIHIPYPHIPSGEKMESRMFENNSIMIQKYPKHKKS